MAQFIQPRRRSSSGRNDDNDYNEPLTPSSSTPNEVSRGAQDSLDNIDAVLKQNEENPNLFNPSGDQPSSGDSGAESPESLGEAEAGAAGNFSFNPERKGKTGTLGRVVAAARGNKKKALAGGGIAGAIIGFIAIIFFTLIPLKIEHIVQNLQNRFFATSQSAIQNQSQKMFTEYMEKHVLPGYKGKCGSTIDKTCSAIKLVGTNPITNMYKTWSNAKLENKLATDYGIEFQYHSDGNWYLKAPGTLTSGDKIGPNGEGLDGEFQKANRATMRNAINDAMQNETKWKQMYYRFKVGRLLEEKYGIRRCLIFCGVTDPLKDKVAEQKIAAKLFLADRVITPRDKTLGVAITCLLNPDCHPEQVKPSTIDPETGGAPISDTEAEINNNFQQLAETLGVKDAEELQKIYTELSDKGVQNYLIEYIFAQVFDKEVAGSIADKIPILGWINLAAKTITAANDSGPKVRKLAYLTNSAAAVSLYMAYRTYADEIHTGNVNATEVGSLVDSLGPGNSGNPNDAEVGGTAGAEGTPLYSKLIDNSTSPSASKDYKCNNGNSVPDGKLVCSEEVLGQGNGALNAIHEFLNLPGFGVITTLANFWTSSVGQVFKFISSALGFVLSPVVTAFDAQPCILQNVEIPGYCAIKDLASSASSTIIKALTQWVIPNPFGTNMGGGRNFDMVAAGADVSGHDSCEAIGCESVNPVTYNNVVNEQLAQEQQQFTNSSLFARMFDTNSQYSLVSKVATVIPFGLKSSLGASFASFMTNPFGALGHGFASVFSSPAGADTNLSQDAFGVTQEAFPTDQIPSNPEAAWEKYNCNDTSQNGPVYQWQQAAANSTPDPNNGMPIHSTVQPCLLMQAVVGSAGGFFDSSLLTQDDLADVNGSSSTSSSSGSASGLVWPFATKDSSQYNRIDQGWDIQDKAGAPIYAIAAGTLNTYNPDPGGFGNDYPVEHLDSSIGGPSDWVYYGHVHIVPSLRGQHVSAGQLIAYANTTDPQNGSEAPTGWLEIGFAQPNTDAPVDSATAETVVTQAGQKMHDLLISATPASGAGQ